MRNILIAGLLTLAAAGCNSSLDQQSATKVMTSALGGTAAAQVKLKPVAGATNASFDGDILNPAGTGSAHVSGSATQTSSGWNVNFDITFNHWTDLAANVTIDGALHETASFSTMAPLVGSVKISGNVAATGSVQAAVDFGLDVNYSPTHYQVSGHVGGASMDATVNL